MIREKNGITLISIIITIIIMLILSGISLNFIYNDNSIINWAIKAGIKSDIAGNLTPSELAEKYPNKFKLTDIELIYIGNDEEEKQWCREYHITVQSDIENIQ